MNHKSPNHRFWLFLVFVFVLIFTVAGVGCDDDDEDYASHTVTQETKKTLIQSDDAARVDPYYIWLVHYYYGRTASSMTQQDCQNWLDLWRSGKAFAAIRMPDEAQILADDVNTSEMLVTSFRTSPPSYVGMPLHPAPERQDFVEHNLPAATGEHWVAIAGQNDANLTCEWGDLGAGEWEIEFFYRLDFGGDQTAGNQEIVTEYLCYEGQDPPFFFPTAPASTALLKRVLVQADGVTCAGPFKSRLSDKWPEWEVHGFFFQHYDAPGVIQLRYAISKPGVEYAFNLSLDSELEAGWGLYKGDENGPYQPLQPIEEPYVTSASSVYVWAVGEAPANTADGKYTTTLNISVSSPTDAFPDHAESATEVWIGAWTPPGPTSYSLFMPVLTRK